MFDLDRTSKFLSVNKMLREAWLNRKICSSNTILDENNWWFSECLIGIEFLLLCYSQEQRFYIGKRRPDREGDPNIEKK